jgi:hypothetical protein
MSNVIPLFKEDPVKELPSNLNSVISTIVDWAETQGVDIYSDKFKYECAMISSQLQILVNNV